MQHLWSKTFEEGDQPRGKLSREVWIRFTFLNSSIISTRPSSSTHGSLDLEPPETHVYKKVERVRRLPHIMPLSNIFILCEGRFFPCSELKLREALGGPPLASVGVCRSPAATSHAVSCFGDGPLTLQATPCAGENYQSLVIGFLGNPKPKVSL